MIIADALYNAKEIMNALGVKDHTLRQARKQGLRVITFCTKPYIIGRDLIEFFDKLDAAEKVQTKFQEIKDQVEELNEQTRKLNAENNR